MKCKICNVNDAEFNTINGESICYECSQEKRYVKCVKCGRVVEISEDEYFTDMALCPQCFDEGEE